MKPRVAIDGRLPKAFGLSRQELKRAAENFVARSSARSGIPFREVTVILQDDASSAEVHLAVNGAEGPTDAITQGYDPMPGEEKGIYVGDLGAQRTRLQDLLEKEGVPAEGCTAESGSNRRARRQGDEGR